MRGSKTLRSVLASFAAAVALLACAAPALADSMTNIGSFADPRTDLPSRPGQLVKALYGPYTIPANGQINSFPPGYVTIAPPCTNCRITDIVADLVDSSTGASVNLREGPMMHHIVLLNPGRADVVCPAGLPGNWGDRFYAAGNERTHLHLPLNFGYENDSAQWRMIYHLVNKSAAAKSVNIQVTYRWRPKPETQPAIPAWLDIDGCNGDSEYSIPTGYSDFHDADNMPVGGPYTADWTVPWNARLIAAVGHSHDVDITGGGACDPHCASAGGGIAVSAELRGAPGATYYGPSPPNRAPPSDLTGSTLCRSQTRFNTAWGGGVTGPWKGHLDTMTLCGIFTSVPAGAQTEAYPPAAAFPANGLPVSAGQVIRLHSEYQNDTGVQQNDVMGIMLPWFAQVNDYPRPGSGTPMRVPLVTAYRQCTSPNSTHVGPLNLNSCKPPAEESSLITTSVARQSAFAKFRAIPGNLATPADEADVAISANITDVLKTSDASEYIGKVLLTGTLRLTDRQNGPAEAGTVQDNPFNVLLDCVTTPSATVGAACSASTSADTLVPNTMKEGQRMIMGLSGLQAMDAGPNGTGYGAGCPPTCGDGDEKAFLTQGVFTP